MVDKGSGGAPASNADWSRDETVLLMALYRRHPKAEKRHPEVVALSALLRGAALARGAAISPTYRNPAGIAMKLRNFAKYDPSPTLPLGAGLRGGGKVDRQVWGEFGRDDAALAAEVVRVRRAFSSGLENLEAPSRGPGPASGTHVHVRDDVAGCVYLALVDGPLDILAPDRPDPAATMMVMKVGRTGDLDRRIAELRSGLPPLSSIAYVPLAVRDFAGGEAAHEFEQTLLAASHQRGWSLGREFVLAEPEAMLNLMISLAEDGAS
ncbi:MAG: hypothetical protein DI591_10585 [Citromicrobium sp.]|nr:MAG: hypothetical protein DI591_10585 [Citromicrobium sp.]